MEGWRVWGLKSRFWGMKFRGLRLWDLGPRVLGLDFWVFGVFNG